jgi:hypothetical protein
VFFTVPRRSTSIGVPVGVGGGEGVRTVGVGVFVGVAVGGRGVVLSAEMLAGLFGALKPVLATMLIGGATVAVAAPVFDMAAHQASASRAAHGPEATPEPSDDDPDATPKPAFDVLLRECLDSRDPDSDECAAAALESGMSYDDFRAKIAAKLEPEKTRQPEQVVKPEPKTDPTKKPEPVLAKKPEPTKNTSDFATWFEKCLATRDINSDECYRAEELSGLSFGDFEDKFNAKLAAKDAGDFGTWFEKCLQSRDVLSEPCAKAQQLIGFNDADFHAKFDSYLAERDAKTGKATPKPTAKTYLTTAMLEECGATHQKTSDACVKALALSGLRADEFWAKLTAKFGPFN